MALRILAIASCLCITAGGCGQGSAEVPDYGLADEASVWIGVAEGPYAPGALVQLAVHNRSDLEYVWNPCMRTLERRSGAAWVPLDESDRVCTAEGWLLAPDQRTAATTELPSGITRGEYRFHYSFWRAEASSSVSDHQVSNSFTVGR